MIYFEIAAEIVLLVAFFYGAIMLWKKGKPLYFQIIIAAIGCYCLYQLLTIVMTFCMVTETYFNDGFFGLAGCYLFLLCANRGTLEKLFDKPKRKYTFVSILSGILMFAFSIGVGFAYFEEIGITFYLYIIEQIPACFIVYYNVKHLFEPADELGLIKGIRLVDIFSMIFCIFSTFDIFLWTNPNIISGIGDFVLSIIALGLSISTVKGAQKWNY